MTMKEAYELAELRAMAIEATPPGGRFECVSCKAFRPGFRPHTCGSEREELETFLAAVKAAKAKP